MLVVFAPGVLLPGKLVSSLSLLPSVVVWNGIWRVDCGWCEGLGQRS